MSETSAEPIPDEEQLLRAPDVMEHTGATYRQLDYWTRQGLVAVADAEQSSGSVVSKPIRDVARPGSGRAKLWHPAEVEAVRRAVIVARALAGLPNEMVFRIARAEGPVTLAGGVVVTTPWGGA